MTDQEIQATLYTMVFKSRPVGIPTLATSVIIGYIAGRLKTLGVNTSDDIVADLLKWMNTNDIEGNFIRGLFLDEDELGDPAYPVYMVPVKIPVPGLQTPPFFTAGLKLADGLTMEQQYLTMWDYLLQWHGSESAVKDYIDSLNLPTVEISMLPVSLQYLHIYPDVLINVYKYLQLRKTVFDMPKGLIYDIIHSCGGFWGSGRDNNEFERVVTALVYAMYADKYASQTLTHIPTIEETRKWIESNMSFVDILNDCFKLSNDTDALILMAKSCAY